MNRKKFLLSTLGILVLAVVLETGVARAHGISAVTVKPATVEAGGTITISGDGLGEAGESVLLMLEGSSYQAPLGTVVLTSDAFENAEFTIPSDAPAGDYVVKAQNGPVSAVAPFAVVAPSASHSPPASAASSVPARVWTPLEWGVAVGLVVLSLGTAVVLLWRARSDFTAIDW